MSNISQMRRDAAIRYLQVRGLPVTEDNINRILNAKKPGPKKPPSRGEQIAEGLGMAAGGAGAAALGQWGVDALRDSLSQQAASQTATQLTKPVVAEVSRQAAGQAAGQAGAQAGAQTAGQSAASYAGNALGALGAAYGAYNLYEMGADSGDKHGSTSFSDTKYDMAQGAAAGAALGSVIPGVGTALGAALGAAYGYGLRAFGSGKSEKQMIDDKIKDSLADYWGVLGRDPSRNSMHTFTNIAGETMDAGLAGGARLTDELGRERAWHQFNAPDQGSDTFTGQYSTDDANLVGDLNALAAIYTGDAGDLRTRTVGRIGNILRESAGYTSDEYTPDLRAMFDQTAAKLGGPNLSDQEKANILGGALEAQRLAGKMTQEEALAAGVDVNEMFGVEKSFLDPTFVDEYARNRFGYKG